MKRLRVHTALSGRNDSAVVSEILLSYLTRFGQGKELFDHPDTLEDRQDTPPE